MEADVLSLPGSTQELGGRVREWGMEPVVALVELSRPPKGGCEPGSQFGVHIA